MQPFSVARTQLLQNRSPDSRLVLSKFCQIPTNFENRLLGGFSRNPCKTNLAAKLPADLKDHFAAAAWKTPHLYLNEDYRLNISSFRLAEAEAVENGVKHLAADLENGRWDKSYGEVLKTDKIDAGYYFLLAK
jgi:hypothetical protein